MECARCGRRVAEPIRLDPVSYYLFVYCAWIRKNRFCGDCAGFARFMQLLMVGAVTALAVLTMIIGFA
jgi:hypothetical protein